MVANGAGAVIEIEKMKIEGARPEGLRVLPRKGCGFDFIAPRRKFRAKLCAGWRVGKSFHVHEAHAGSDCNAARRNLIASSVAAMKFVMLRPSSQHGKTSRFTTLFPPAN